METELEIIDSLNALDYQGKCLQNDELTRALEGGTRSVEFREVVAWLAQELHILRKTDESVSKECDDPNEFAMELSAMLKELGCPYNRFVTGPLSERFETKEDRLQLIDFLITELMATKMVLRLKPAEQTYVIPKSETNTAKALESLTKDLCLGKPPENISPKALFDKLNFKVEERMRAVKPGVISEPLLKTNKPLTDAQWQKLQEIYEDLDKEYNLRRQVLLTRLEVTVQSFQWSDKMKTRENEIVERFQKKLKEMEYLQCGSSEDTNIVALLAARADLAVIEKTSSANVRKNTATKLQKHIIGSVPDRGGRAHEHAPPPPEMPSWQQQRSAGPAGGGGRGGGGNFRGGRGGGSGGGGNWQQNSQPQRQQHQQHYQSQQHHQQQQNYDQPQRDQNWIQGSGRVQGSGWVQGSGGGGGNYQGGGGNYHGGGGNYQGGGGNYQGGGGGNYQGGGGGNHYQNNDRDNRGGGGSYRGRSNYNRGGGGGGHRR